MQSNPRTRRLSADEMLELWRLVRHFEPLAGEGATIARADGPDLDRALREDLRRWYARCYAELPARHLPQEDFAPFAEMRRTPDGIGIVSLPERCAVPLDILVEGWERPAVITTPDTPLAADQSSPFIRGGMVNPVAVVSPSGEMRLYTVPDGADIDRLTGVALPEEGYYLVTDRMLPEIFED